jgi:hypothetical protein
MTEKITKEWVQDQGFEIYVFYNGDWRWEDKDGYWHFIKDGVDLLEGKKAIYYWPYDNGDLKWTDEDNYCHLIRDDIDLLKGKKAVDCWSYKNGDWKWEDENYYWHLIRNDIDLLDGKKAKWCQSYNNGDWEWEDEERYRHLIRDGVELTKGLKAIDCRSYENGDWGWADEDKHWHFKKEDEDRNTIHGQNNSKQTNRSTTMTNKITKEWAKDQGFGIFEFSNEVWEWKDEDGYLHLIRDGMDLLEGKNAIACWSYENGDWDWQDEDCYLHLIRDGVDLLEGKNAIACHSYDNGDWEWQDEDKHWHFKKEYEDIDTFESKKTQEDTMSYENVIENLKLKIRIEEFKVSLADVLTTEADKLFENFSKYASRDLIIRTKKYNEFVYSKLLEILQKEM